MKPQFLLPALFLALVHYSGSAGEMENSDPDPDGPPVGVEQGFTVHGIFGHNMVVQQGKPLCVRGLGTTGDEVAVTVSWADRDVRAVVDAGGEWTVEVQVPRAPAGYRRNR
ncbi:MAG: hypothetical protein LUE26_01400 [Alistipes sp.]|nr:hypothetical protein [Alistipes sp.]